MSHLIQTKLDQAKANQEKLVLEIKVLEVQLQIEKNKDEYLSLPHEFNFPSYPGYRYKYLTYHECYGKMFDSYDLGYDVFIFTAINEAGSIISLGYLDRDVNWYCLKVGNKTWYPNKPKFPEQQKDLLNQVQTVLIQHDPQYQEEKWFDIIGRKSDFSLRYR